MSQELFDAVIVGAGPSGLAAAIEGKRYGLRYVVLEKGGITNSILHFPTQMIFFTTPELLEIGGVPLVSEREKPTRNEALKYYRKVVGAFQLDVHQYEEVVGIHRDGTGKFHAETAKAVYEARNIVLAIGYYDNPNYMGEGAINFTEVVKAIRDIGFTGYCNLETDTKPGSTVEADMRKNLTFIRHEIERA